MKKVFYIAVEFSDPADIAARLATVAIENADLIADMGNVASAIGQTKANGKMFDYDFEIRENDEVALANLMPSSE